MFSPTWSPFLINWEFGLVVNGNVFVSINKVALRRARLVLGWVTVCGWAGKPSQPPRLTQHSTLCSEVKCISACGLSNNNNKWQWWTLFIACLWLKLLGAMLCSSHEPSELLQWLYHDDSTINTVLVIIIILKWMIQTQRLSSAFTEHFFQSNSTKPTSDLTHFSHMLHREIRKSGW